jgi:hypothetical protein
MWALRHWPLECHFRCLCALVSARSIAAAVITPERGAIGGSHLGYSGNDADLASRTLRFGDAGLSHDCRHRSDR